MGKRQPNMQAVRRARWERQRREAIKREQVERCYKQHIPPQIATAQHRQEPNGLYVAYNRACDHCGRIGAIGSQCVYCEKHRHEKVML